jgi:hypothetical protein
VAGAIRLAGMKSLALSAALALLSLGVLRADHPAAPDGAAVEGSDGGPFGAALTTQQLYVAEDLPGLQAGDVITGISLRLNGGSPAFAGATFARFDLHLGMGKASLTTTFADNFEGPAATVRSGALVLAAAAFPSGGSPNSFGPVIAFDTPYIYQGGNLLLELRVTQPSPDFSIDFLNDTEGAGGQMTLGLTADATAAITSIISRNLAIAFEVTRAGATPERIAIPDGAATEGNTGGNFNHVGGLAEHMNYLPAQLGSLKPGDRIAGIGFRLTTEVSEFQSTTFPRFDIRMGRASAGYSTNAGTTFAANFASPPALMRSGPMTLFLAAIAGNPNPFATHPIHFATPYTYTGGPLLFETRSSEQTTPLTIDHFLVPGYGGGLLKSGDLDALVGEIPQANHNWAMELYVLRDQTAPVIAYSGKAKLKRGRARVKGTVSEAGTVATIAFTSSSRQRGAASANAATQPFSFPIRSRKPGKRVKVTVTATDASGNSSTARRVYRP